MWRNEDFSEFWQGFVVGAVTISVALFVIIILLSWSDFF